jgi:hypothetical protein
MQLFLAIGTIGDQRRPIDSRLWRQDEARHGPVTRQHGRAHGQEVLVRTDQAEMTKGKNVVISDELRN